MIDNILNGSEVLNEELKPFNTAVNRSGSSSSSRSSDAVSAQERTYAVSTPNGTYTNLTKEQYDKLQQALSDYNTAYGIAYSYNVSAPSWPDFNGDNGKSIIDAVIFSAIKSGHTSKSDAWAKVVEPKRVELSAIEQKVRRLANEYNIEFTDAIREKIYSGQADEVLASYQQKAQEIADITARVNAKYADGTYTAPSPAGTYTAPSPTAATTVSPSTSDGSKGTLLWLLLGAAAIGLGIMLSKSNSKKRK